MSDASVGGESHIPGSTPQISGPQRVSVTASIKPSPAPANEERTLSWRPVVGSQVGELRAKSRGQAVVGTSLSSISDSVVTSEKRRLENQPFRSSLRHPK